jgi:hypothetical protein
MCREMRWGGYGCACVPDCMGVGTGTHVHGFCRVSLGLPVSASLQHPPYLPFPILASLGISLPPVHIRPPFFPSVIFTVPFLSAASVSPKCPLLLLCPSSRLSLCLISGSWCQHCYSSLSAPWASISLNLFTHR